MRLRLQAGVPRSAYKSNYKNIFKTFSRLLQDSLSTYHYWADQLSKPGKRKGAGDADTASGALKGQAFIPYLAVIWYVRAAQPLKLSAAVFKGSHQPAHSVTEAETAV